MRADAKGHHDQRAMDRLLERIDRIENVLTGKIPDDLRRRLDQAAAVLMDLDTEKEAAA